MAYVTSPQVAHVRKALKAAFPEFKFSVTGGGTPAIIISLMEGSVDLSKDAPTGYIQLDPCWLRPTNNEELYRKILDTAMNALGDSGDVLFGDSDALVDYPYTAYYYYLNIGKLNKPYQFKQS